MPVQLPQAKLEAKQVPKQVLPQQEAKQVPRQVLPLQEAKQVPQQQALL